VVANGIDSSTLVTVLVILGIVALIVFIARR
jgi:hypothetical protein